MHEKWMNLALEQARLAKQHGEVPVGAVLVKDGFCLAAAHNLVESKKDPTAHAEILCIKKAASQLGNWRLSGAVLYCTLEPCVMCAGAMISARIGGLVWGAPDHRQGGGGSFINVFGEKHPIHNFPIISGVLETEASSLLKEFFQERRVANKTFVD